jgi:RHS repeat-associated protein
VTLYFQAFGVLAERFGQLTGPQRWTSYLMAGGRLIGIQVENADETTLTRYFHTDHLGSIAVISNEVGGVMERLSYDAWGLRRHPDGTPDPAGSIASQSTRGFTGHEHLAEVGLIHMNGRVYDPLLARFGTPDPTTEAPFSTQGWNRYTYVGNSPVNFTDPSGYCFMGCFWKPLFRAVGNFFRQNWGAILQIAATALCGGNPVCGAIVGGATSAFVVGVSGGSLGDALRAGFISAATIGAMWGVGELTGGFNGVLDTTAGGHGPLAPGSEAHLFNIAGHALVGCARAVASRASCGSGALAGAIGPTVAPALLGRSFQFRLVANSVMGGLASVAGGGSFANGAVTAAFGYLFNHCARVPGGCARALEDAASMATDWALDTGASTRVFGPGSIQVIDMMDAPGVNDARDYFYNKYAAAMASKNYAALGSVTNYQAYFGPGEFLETSFPFSPTRHFVGSYRVNIFAINGGADLMFELNNNSSFKSFGYGQTPAWERSTFGPAGNMRQTYWWIEPRRP